MKLPTWLRRLLGDDDETQAARKAFAEAYDTPPVEVALDHVIAAADRAASAAKRQARMTPPPIPRLAPLPSIPEEA